MRQENQQKFSDLAYDLRKVQTDDAPGNMGPFVLFLGGSASTIQGRPFLDELRQQVLLEPRGKRFSKEEIAQMALAVQIEAFNQKWSKLGQGRTATLYAVQQKLLPTDGHTYLAAILKERYFPLVLTSTLDQLVEATFVSHAMKNGEPPPLWKVLVNDADTPKDAFQRLLQYGPGSLAPTILRLCGSITTGSSAVTHTEVEAKIHLILDCMVGLLQRNLVIVGATALDEVILQQVFQSIPASRENSIYYINKTEPSSTLDRWLRQWDATCIIEDEINFDVAFQTLAQQFSLFQKAETIQGGAPLDQPNFERLRTEQGQTEEQTLVAYLKNTAPPTASPVVVPTPVEEPLVELLPDDNPPVEAENPLVNLVKDITVVTVTIHSDRRATFTVKDKAKYNFSSKEPSEELKFNLANLNKSMQYMGDSIAAFYEMDTPRAKALRDRWRAQAKQEGIDLYKDLIKPIPDLESMLAVTRGTSDKEDPANVTLAFEGPRHYLSMPYELLYYQDLPLVLQHPLCRKVSGFNVRAEHFDSFFYTLHLQKKGRLRVLLIASDTPNTTSDDEISELEKVIDKAVQQRSGVKPIIDTLPTAQASIQNVRDRLRNCTYHIVHYAGHGVFDETTGENSGLRLWQGNNRAGGRVTLTAREIASLLGQCETRLFYVNACVGAEVSSEQVLRGNDYLGIMDAIVQARVPYVLGFRWYVTDSGSRNFATHFYEQLFKRPLVPELAVLQARKRIYEEDPLDETWISPILVAQTPYLYS